MRKIAFKAEIDSKHAQKELDNLKRKIVKTEESLSTATSKRSAIEQQMDAAAAKADETREKIKLLREEMAIAQARADRTASNPQAHADALAHQQQVKTDLQDQERILAQQVKHADALGRQYDKADQRVQTITATLERQQEAAGRVERNLASAYDPSKLRAATQQMGASIKHGISAVLKWGLALRSLYVAYRALRKAAAEGIQEMARYDSTTNKALSSIKTASAGFKAAVTSAFSQILQVIAPIVTKIIHAISSVINWIGMLFAALRGQTTYKKAIAGEVDYAKALSGTAAAAKEATNNLSGLDEVRKFDDGSSSSAGGGAGAGAIEAVEELEIPSKFKKATDFILKHMKAIKVAAIGIGSAILAWKISSALGLAFKDVLAVIMLIAGAVETVKSYLDLWADPADTDALRGYLLGLAAVAVALGLLISPIAAGIALIAGGIALIVLAIHDSWDEIKAWWKEKVAVWFTREKWQGLATDAKAAFEKRFKITSDKVRAWYEEKVAPWFTAEKWADIAHRAKEWIDSKVGPATDAIKTWYTDKVKPWFTAEKWQSIAQDAKTKLEAAIAPKTDAIKTWYTDKVKPWFTAEKWQDVAQEMKSKFESAIAPKTEALKEWYTGKVKPWLDPSMWLNAGRSALDALKNGFSIFVWNPLSSWWSSNIAPWLDWHTWYNAGRDAINSLSEGLRSLSLPTLHVSWDYASKTVLGRTITIPTPRLQMYARGGIVDGPTYIGNGRIAGEDGAEAIVPLERHTQWLNGIAERLADLLEDSLGTRLAAIMDRTPLPAVASGTYLPPRLTADIVGLDDLRADIQSLADALKRQRGGDYRFTAMINRRTLFDEMIDEARLRQRSSGSNPLQDLR